MLLRIGIHFHVDTPACAPRSGSCSSVHLLVAVCVCGCPTAPVVCDGAVLATASAIVSRPWLTMTVRGFFATGFTSWCPCTHSKLLRMRWMSMAGSGSVVFSSNTGHSIANPRSRHIRRSFLHLCLTLEPHSMKSQSSVATAPSHNAHLMGPPM